MSAGPTYAAGGALLDRWIAARSDHDGDAFVALHTPDAEVAFDPFAPPVVGSNGLRAWLLAASDREGGVEFTVERHWVVAPTILAAWHASHVDERTGARVRTAGFLTFEVGDDGRISRARFWTTRAATPAGEER